jgi:hypothetical protein
MNFLINNLDQLVNIIVLITCSLYLRFLLQFVGQNWIKTISHTSTLLLLPILTYVITSVISGNIALSLGMVGALSIVRFRNPVRSPLELSTYFGAITLGISAAVAIKWLIFLVGAVTLVALVLLLINFITNALGRSPFFITSFSEGNEMSSLQVVASQQIVELDSSESLNSKISSDGVITYVLTDTNFSKLKQIDTLLQNNSTISSLHLSK